LTSLAGRRTAANVRYYLTSFVGGNGFGGSCDTPYLSAGHHAHVLATKVGTMSTEQFWLSIGFLGQAFFSMRFIVQWVASEKRKESVIPVAFWFFSIGGGLTLFTYALHRLDPVFVVGEAAGTLIYTRNLYLIWRKRRRASPASA
jgi:lipid-A-disaccharide synthase-like uncharacterized protein